jgi:hypothetical protein
MTDLNTDVNALLTAARDRGTRAVGTAVIPPGLDHFTVYAGLIGSALELAKLIQTEERDLKVIDSHYQIETQRISAAFREVEAAMIADFKRDESLKEKTFEMIQMLIAAGQFEVAGEFHGRLINSFQRPALEAIIEHRKVTGGSYIRLK